MTEKVEKRRAALINLAYIVVILALFYLFFKFCLPFAAPFLISFFVAVILQRPLKWMDKKSKGKCHALWSILLVLLLILLVIGPIVIIFSMLFKEIAGFVSFLANQLNDTPTLLATIEKELLDLLKFLPDGLYTKVSDSITQTFGSLIHDFDLSKLGIDMKSVSSGVSSGITGIFSFVKNIPSILIGIVIGIISAIFFTKDYRRVVNFIKLQLPDNNKNILVEIKQVFFNTVLKMLRAYGIIMFITFCELFIGMSIMKVAGIMHNNYIFIIAICVAIFDILPVAGSGGILIPWLLISFIVGNVAQGIGLLVLYIILSVVRQYIEPKIVGESLGVHPLITLAGLYFGLKLFGFYGMFIVPLSLMTIKAFNDTGRIHLYVPPQTHEEKK